METGREETGNEKQCFIATDLIVPTENCAWMAYRIFAVILSQSSTKIRISASYDFFFDPFFGEFFLSRLSVFWIWWNILRARLYNKEKEKLAHGNWNSLGTIPSMRASKKLNRVNHIFARELSIWRSVRLLANVW